MEIETNQTTETNVIPDAQTEKANKTWGTPLLRVAPLQETEFGFTGGTVEDGTYAPLDS